MNKEDIYKKSPNVYLLTWNGSGNYGTNLQAYALYNYIKKLGYCCYMFSGVGKMTISIFFQKIWNKIDRKILKKLKQDYEDSVKTKKIQKYLDENFVVVKFNTTNKVRKCSKDSIFLIGSDQIWNPNYLNKVMLLDFLPDNYIRRYSYAASVGISSIPDRYVHIYRKYLNKFKLITVRERSSQNALEKVLSEKNTIKCVVDPTFLLNDQEWKAFAMGAVFGQKLPKRYILCYFVGNKDYTNLVKNITKCYEESEILQIAESSIGFSLQYGQAVLGAGPREFVWLIHHATVILTDSFHATALSIILKKNFFVFKRFDDSDKKSQNGRLIDLLTRYNLLERQYPLDKKIDYFKDNIDYEKVYKILQSEIIESQNILKSMLDGVYD